MSKTKTKTTLPIKAPWPKGSCPPADSYIVVKPKDKLSLEVDLLKAYELQAGKKIHHFL